ncbi:MAG: hypothetical protein HY394_06470 [Candidatus Diapherotrites archaeon]|nr:hypothetical protein [Candidatus Diapherotrites archaeon]
MQFEQVLKFSYSWLKEKRSVKFFAATICLALAFYTLLGGLIFLAAGPAVMSLLSGDALSATAGFLSALPAIIVGGIIIYIAYIALMFFIQAKAVVFGMSKAGYRHDIVSKSKVLRFLLLSIAEGFVALFSLFKPKLLAILGVSLVLFVAGIIFAKTAGLIATLMIITGFVGLLVYVAVIIYNSYRLSVAVPIFFETNAGIMSSLKQSWKITRGNVLNILISGIIVFVPLFVAAFVLDLVAKAPAGFMYASPASINAMLATMALSTIAGLIVLPAQILIETFFHVGIYRELSPPRNAQQAVRQPAWKIEPISDRPARPAPRRYSRPAQKTPARKR